VVEQKRSFKRRQLPLQPAKALTVHGAQGKTLPAVCVDLVPPPGVHTAEQASAIYVALSRVRRLEDLVILRPFRLEDIQLQPDGKLIAELDRLRTLAVATKQKVVCLRRAAGCP
jgi:ATP-dependent exoDNAse (exonuclease V) alpha subunit